MKLRYIKENNNYIIKPHNIMYYGYWGDMARIGCYKDDWFGLWFSIDFEDVTNFPSGIKIQY